MNVYFNGSHIPNSPFKVRVCNPEAIWAEGPGLMDSFTGEQGDFQVFTKDAGHGTLSKCSDKACVLYIIYIHSVIRIEAFT